MKTWTDDKLEILISMSATHQYADIAVFLGVGVGAVRNKLWRLGVRKRAEYWAAEEERALVDAYQKSDIAEEIDLTALANSLGRLKSNVCRKARELGLTNQQRKMVTNLKVRLPMFSTALELSAYKSEVMKRTWKEKDHPRGMKGKRHTEESKALIAEKSKQFAANESDEERSKRMLKANQTRERNGTLYPPRKGVTWKAGWREVGGVRKYYRSRWEANYAHYLEWLKAHGEIKEWKHEPKTFWFEGIKRGTNSYLPDFWVLENSGAEAYHEVKGWMDDRSKTKIRRMAKYHPSVKLIVIDAKAYAAIKKSVQSIIQGWES